MFFNVEKQLKSIKKQLNSSSDVATRVIQTASSQKVGMIFLRSMINSDLFLNGLCKPISESDERIDIEKLASSLVKTGDIKKIDEKQACDSVINGSVVIIIEGESKMLAVDLQKYPARLPAEPPTSSVIQGPREGFVEDVKTNITLLRRRFYTKDLTIKELRIGKFSQTKIVIAYIKGIADKKVVSEISTRLKQIDVDGVIDSQYIMQFLEKRPHSLFKQVGSIEKPDIVAAKMLEGRVAIIVDGSPIVLTLPFLFLEDVQSSDDYYNSHIYGGFIRVVRIIAVLIALLLPATYISLRIFHSNVTPIKFLVTITNTTKGLPFTPFFEMIFISLLFQILYEVSLRLPSYLGLATSIVGALILGDTGVKAGLISPPGVIIVALAKIALYTVPEQAYQLTILQYLFLFIGGSLGMLGIVGLAIYLITYMASIDSYGAPYLAPFAPRVEKDLKDAILISNTLDMKTRPQSFKNKNITRQK